MADNYLEKKYEEYLIKKAKYEKAKKLGILPSNKKTTIQNKGK